MKIHNQKNTYCSENYEHAQMHKEMIIQKLKDKGIRMTRQRLILLDIILEAECCSCKEIYYKAVNTGEKIGLSTVYRLVNILEEIGAIIRPKMESGHPHRIKRMRLHAGQKAAKYNTE